MHELRVSFSPEMSAVRGLAQMVEAFGDVNELPQDKVFMINLAVDELIMNTVSYGLQQVTQPEVEFTLQATGTVLALTMVDNGHPFDPTEDTDPDLSSGVDERAIGGLGLHLVKAFAHRMKYEYVDGRNRLTLEHDLAPDVG